MTTYVDKTGKPITEAEWFVLFADEDYRRIGETTVCNLWISTVWLGLGIGSQYFETMVFGTQAPPWNEMSPIDVWSRRYETWIEAQDGHAKVVVAVR